MAPHHLHAQTVGGGNASSNTESNASNDNKNSASVNTGNNVFDFSSNGANTPNGPPLPSFSGGPCLGTSASVGGSAPGISIGGGYSREDEACQRRNWVQTLIGAAQHMTPEEAALMRRLALEVMRGQLSLSAADFDNCRLRMEQPEPRVALGLALRGVANACIDLSDGLAGDLGHVLKASQVGAVLTTDWVQDSAAISVAMQSLPFARRLDMALAGGDDHELLFTAAPEQADAVQHAANEADISVTCIGRITPGSGLQVLDLQGVPISRRFASFDHFVH